MFLESDGVHRRKSRSALCDSAACREKNVRERQRSYVSILHMAADSHILVEAKREQLPSILAHHLGPNPRTDNYGSILHN